MIGTYPKEASIIGPVPRIRIEHVRCKDAADDCNNDTTRIGVGEHASG
jgi:hypothetical protein